jgi:hypothetical protein
MLKAPPAELGNVVSVTNRHPQGGPLQQAPEPVVDDASMGSALDRFRTMMRQHVAPELRRMGFRGSGQSFVLPSEDYWVLLGFQRSRSSSAEAVRFTVNTTVVSKQEWAQARERASYLPERPTANTSYGTFAWWKRIGRLLPDGQDRWWTLSSGSAIASLAAEVLDAIRTYALPAIHQQLEASQSNQTHE